MVHQSWRFCGFFMRCSAATSMKKPTVACIRVASLLSSCTHRSDPWELRILGQYLNPRDPRRVQDCSRTVALNLDAH